MDEMLVMVYSRMGHSLMEQLKRLFVFDFLYIFLWFFAFVGYLVLCLVGLTNDSLVKFARQLIKFYPQTRLKRFLNFSDCLPQGESMLVSEFIVYSFAGLVFSSLVTVVWG